MVPNTISVARTAPTSSPHLERHFQRTKDLVVQRRDGIGACRTLRGDVSDPPKHPLASRHMPNQLVGR